MSKEEELIEKVEKRLGQRQIAVVDFDSNGRPRRLRYTWTREPVTMIKKKSSSNK